MTLGELASKLAEFETRGAEPTPDLIEVRAALTKSEKSTLRKKMSVLRKQGGGLNGTPEKNGAFPDPDPNDD